MQVQIFVVTTIEVQNDKPMSNRLKHNNITTLGVIRKKVQ